MPNELDIDVCPRCVWRSVPKAKGVCVGCGYPVAEIDSLRARLDATEGLIAAMDEQERLNNVKDTNYSGFLTAFRRQEHKADVTKAREKWEAVK